ncbi:MAG: hypothetical protein DRI37_01770 [Chloroflexi bacterium]|nr:MAG: hypothetical protein DRI37_01770 [Chloroflexota bacterium]
MKGACMKTVVHIINHTHWDREWFLTSIYTNPWIPKLIDTLERLAAGNPDYQFLLDGQTLVIEDLLKLAPGYRDKVDRLVNAGHLIIGPYYCQPDWQITGGESLIRNLLYGRKDMQQHDGRNHIGWLVDTFGHISQAPQLHQLFGLNAVFVWRGVPQIEPYFRWQGANGQQLLTINLFGGYRNLYGITHVPEVAIQRLKTEVAKLRPYYPTGDIPLFDGYDLEQNPEDPAHFYRQHATAMPENIQIRESSPGNFAQEVRAKVSCLPIIAGELNSGKYGAVFPGTLSTRTYLKVMNRDCEQLLFKLGEPLATLARLKGRTYPSQQYETWARALLQNTIHDCICGVSIDQVHEKMENSYRQLYQGLKQDVRASLAYILRDFAPGTYAVSTNPFAYKGWQVMGDRIYHLNTNGIGVWEIAGQSPVERLRLPVTQFEWQNHHYTATVNANGVVQVGAALLGYLVVTEEHGDTYSDEAGQRSAIGHAVGPLIIEEKSARHCVVKYACACPWEGAQITATVRLTFDQTPLLRWQVELDSRGTNFRVEMVFKTALQGKVYAGMPFDTVERPTVDKNLLPRQLDKELAQVLLGQRELSQVRTFPFHDLVAIADENSSAVVMAKGIRSYRADDDGNISLTLRRSVEWLTAPDLQYRSGDAGPFMYVPDARCERKVNHEIAMLFSKASIDEMTIHSWNAGFQNPPLVVTTQGTGSQTKWQFLQEDLPLSSLSIYADKLLARFYNPTTRNYPLHREYQETTVWGSPQATIETAPAKGILTLEIAQELPALSPAPDKQITFMTFPEWRVGDNQGLPDPEIIKQLETEIAQLELQLAQVEEQWHSANEKERLLAQHRYYVLKRELYELRLSALLNQRKLALQGQVDHDYLYTADPEIAELGMQLNEQRIKRRIFDYVVETL